MARPASVEPEEVTRRPTSGSWMAPALVALAVLCYANTVHGEFVWDDLKLIVSDAATPRHISEIFFADLWGQLGGRSNYYRPLPALQFTLLHAAFGLRPEPFHLVNIALHAGTTYLVFLTARALLAAVHACPTGPPWPAFAAAALFAVHPIHTEAVAWISGGMDVSCTFFSLLAVYLHATRDSGGRATARGTLSLAAFSLGLLSKEPAAVVPFALVAYDLLFQRPRISAPAVALRRWGPPFAVLIGYACLRSYALGGLAPFQNPQQGTVTEALLVLTRLFALYVQKLVSPVNLNAIHHIELATVPSASTVLLLLVVIVGFGVVSWVAIKRGAITSFGLFVFLLALAPALYLPALRQTASLAFAERYLYFPSAGAALLVAGALVPVGNASAGLRRFAAGSLAAVMVVFAAMTVSRNAVWRDNFALWSDGVRKSPNLALAHFNLGLALEERGSATEAIRAYQAALEREAGYADAHNNLGILLAQQGRLDEAIAHLRVAARIHPRDPEVRLNLARAYELKGLAGEAAQQRSLAALAEGSVRPTR